MPIMKNQTYPKSLKHVQYFCYNPELQSKNLYAFFYLSDNAFVQYNLVHELTVLFMEILNKSCGKNSKN